MNARQSDQRQGQKKPASSELTLQDLQAEIPQVDDVLQEIEGALKLTEKDVQEKSCCGSSCCG